MGIFPQMYYTIYTQKLPAEVCAILKGETAAWGIAHYPLGEGEFMLFLFWLIIWIQTRGWYYFDAKGAKQKLEAMFGETVYTD